MLSSTKSADQSETPTASAPAILVMPVTESAAPELTVNTGCPLAIPASRGSFQPASKAAYETNSAAPATTARVPTDSGRSPLAPIPCASGVIESPL